MHSRIELLKALILAVVCSISMRAAAAPPEENNNAVSVTHGAVSVRDGHRISYTARAGYLPLITDGSREETAHIYFAAFIADRVAGAPPRPITFGLA